MNKIVETILFIILCISAWFAGRAVGDAISKKAENMQAQEIIHELDSYAQTAANFREGFAEGQVTPQQYILTTYSLYEEIYRYILDKDLLTDYPDQFNRGCKILEGIYQNQMEVFNNSNNVLAVAGLTTVLVLEMEKYNHLMNILTVKTCEEVLKIDPGNQQALDTIKKVSEQEHKYQQKEYVQQNEATVFGSHK